MPSQPVIFLWNTLWIACGKNVQGLNRFGEAFEFSADLPQLSAINPQCLPFRCPPDFQASKAFSTDPQHLLETTPHDYDSFSSLI